VHAAQGSPPLLHGDADASAVLDAPGEVFTLRKLLPQTPDFDFNIHVMDFAAGEYLNVKARARACAPFRPSVFVRGCLRRPSPLRR
jgi:hypothetical protein